MLAEPPDGAHGADAHHRHLVGLEAAHRGLDEGRRGRVRELVGELAPDPETAAEEERGRWKERLICGIYSPTTESNPLKSKSKRKGTIGLC